MITAIEAKFNLPKYKKLLMELEGPIVEDNYWHDTYWGVCNGVGENRLGIILEAKRTSLIAESMCVG